MITVYKYAIPASASFTLQLPESARVLTVQIQNFQPNIWVELDTDEPTKPRNFYVRGTGHQFTGDEQTYIGTYQVFDGQLVFHLYEGNLHGVD